MNLKDILMLTHAAFIITGMAIFALITHYLGILTTLGAIGGGASIHFLFILMKSYYDERDKNP